MFTEPASSSADTCSQIYRFTTLRIPRWQQVRDAPALCRITTTSDVQRSVDTSGKPSAPSLPLSRTASPRPSSVFGGARARDAGCTRSRDVGATPALPKPSRIFTSTLCDEPCGSVTTLEGDYDIHCTSAPAFRAALTSLAAMRCLCSALCAPHTILWHSGPQYRNFLEHGQRRKDPCFPQQAHVS